MCFGIGEGLGLWYVEMPNMNPSRMVHVRSAEFENVFFSNIQQDFKWETHEDPLEGEKNLISKIDEGIPAIIHTDIYHLPYYNTKTHFPGHVITVWGYDKENETFIVTDTEREEHLSVPMKKLRDARYCDDVFFKSKGNLFAPESIDLPEDMKTVIKKAILSNSKFLASDEISYSGKPAIKKWEDEILAWAEFKNWQWTVRFCYQNIEKRGTGGGGFRKLYSEFLKESSDLIDEIKMNGLDQRMKEVADSWTSLAYSLKDVSEMKSPDFNDSLTHLKNLKNLEMSYHKDVVKIFN